MAHKDFFIYTDRNKLRTSSNTEYRVETLLKPKQLKPSIKGKSFYLRYNIEDFFILIHLVFQRVRKSWIQKVHSLFLKILINYSQLSSSSIKQTIMIYIMFMMKYLSKVSKSILCYWFNEIITKLEAFSKIFHLSN